MASTEGPPGAEVSARKLQVGLKSPQIGVDWPRVCALWEYIDAREDFDSAWLFDHFDPQFAGRSGALEALTLLSALAARTRRLRLGVIVLGNTHRHPALVAKMAATLDQISNGRFVLGLGAGWHETEHQMYGWELPPIGRRMTLLRDSVRIIKGMFDCPSGFTLQTDNYALQGATCLPPPVTLGGPEVWLGTDGDRGIRLAAKWADGWVSICPPTNGSLSQFREKRRAFLSQVKAFRRQAAAKVIVQIPVTGSPLSDLLAHATSLVDEGAEHLILAPDDFPDDSMIQELVAGVVRPLRRRLASMS